MININNLFSLDNVLFRFMGRISDLMILNFLWIITSLPLVTIGASTTALYNTSLKLIDENEGYIVKTYFKAFKENFKKSTIIFSITLASLFVIFINLCFWIQFKSFLGYFTLSITMFLTFIFLLTTIFVFPMISTSNMNIKDLIKESCILSIKYLPYSLAVLFITFLFASVLIIFPFTILFMIFVGVALLSYINSYFIRAVFNKSQARLYQN